jgi:hypothetical protein
MTIAGAKQFLEEQGYYTSNLWHVADVMENYECTEEQAQEVLDLALNNDYTMDQISGYISDASMYLRLKRKEV